MATHSGQTNQSTQKQKPMTGQKPTSTRGFAAMDAEKHRKVSAQGGRASQQQQHGDRQSAQSMLGTSTDASPTESTVNSETVKSNSPDKLD